MHRRQIQYYDVIVCEYVCVRAVIGEKVHSVMGSAGIKFSNHVPRFFLRFGDHDLFLRSAVSTTVPDRVGQ